MRANEKRLWATLVRNGIQHSLGASVVASLFAAMRRAPVIVIPLLDASVAACAAACRAADALGTRICVVVIDISFTPVALSRMDGAFASAVAVATAKAHAAMNFRRATIDMVGQWKDSTVQALMVAEPRIVVVGGGVPVPSRDDGVVAAVGVSGATEAQDSEIAQQAALVLAAALAG